MNANLKFALVASLIGMNAQADNRCWIDHVETFGDGVRVFFIKDANINVQGIKRSGNTVIEQFKAGTPLVLKLGDESGIYGGPHETCVLKADKKENKLGVAATSNNHIPGMPAVIGNQFILPTR